MLQYEHALSNLIEIVERDPVGPPVGEGFRSSAGRVEERRLV